MSHYQDTTLKKKNSTVSGLCQKQMHFFCYASLNIEVACSEDSD